jgi:RHS repeat-associated protein
LNYDLPLTVPPGRNGLQPSLSLSYSSRPSQEVNLFGHGWSVSIPYIERKNYTGSENLYGTSTVFFSSISGDLVTTTSASVFKTKVDDGSFLQYAFSSSTGWTVVDKRGTTYKFGTSSSTQVVDPGNSTHIFRWMLQEVRDTNDNYISYAYTKDGNQIYPDVITYTGHTATPGIFDVHFTKELRTDVATSTAEGFNVSTRYRISEIKAEVNDSWVRKYSLGYGVGDNEERDMLTSVTESGYDGSTTLSLPTSTYAYQTSTKSWSEAVSWDIPEPTVESDYSDTGTRFGDVNGDGLPDLLIREADGSPNKVYMNNGSGWTYDSSWTIPVPITDGATAHPGTLLIDINGDGMVDIARSKDGSASSTYINNGTAWVLSSSTVPVYFSDSSGKDLGVRVADLNGDGLPDLLHNTAWGGNKAYINNGSTWIYDSSWTMPEVTAATVGSVNRDLGVRFADVDGDGLVDVIRRDEAVNKIYLHDGAHGWTLSSLVAPVQIMDSGNDVGTRLEDINGDGLVDFIKSQAVNSTGVYINKGGSWTLDSSYSIPFKIIDFASPYYFDSGTRILDVDGDGLVDLLQYRRGEADKVYLRNGTRPDLLATLTNSQGGVTTVTYKGSPEYGANPRLPLVLDTVQKIAYNDGVGPARDIEYSYVGGLYYSTSTAIRDRKFAGFKMVSETNDFGFVTKSYFHQGDTSSSTIGEYNDHISKIGRIFRTENYDNAGNLFAKATNKWDYVDIGMGANFVKLTDTVNFTHDGNVDHKDKAESFVFSDLTGGLVQKTEWGVVSAGNDGSFSDAGTDKLLTTISYATSTILGDASFYLPYQETTLDQSSNKVRERRIYYDGLSLGSVDEGNPTKEEQWKSGSTYIDTERTYDSYGLVTQEKDPRDKVTAYTYDSFNLYPATSTNPLSHVSSRLYDYSSGKVSQIIDPNGRIFQTLYDPLDRALEEKQPDLANPSTLVTRAVYQYTDNVLPRKVQATRYLNSTTSVDSYIYSDGFGRKAQEKTEAEEAGDYMAKDFAYNVDGLLSKESLPYFSSGSGYTAISSPPANSLLSFYTYDPVGKMRTITNSVGTTTYAYDDWSFTVTDPRNKLKEFTRDAYGNLTSVSEQNGPSAYVTYYEYNGNKNLTKITDADGNVRNFTYDGLGRRLTAQDLHDTGDATFGTWNYAYDVAGNLVSSTDPKSQTVTFNYDDLGRILTEDYDGSGGMEVSYSYDACADGKGRLCAATSTAATVSFSYNPAGVMASQVKIINGTAYTTSYSYDRQGNSTNIIYPDNSEVSYAYNSAGLLERVAQKESGSEFANIISDFDYAPTGKVSHKEFVNGVTSDYTYDETKLYRLDNILTAATSSGIGGGFSDSIYWDGSELKFFGDEATQSYDLSNFLALVSPEGSELGDFDVTGDILPSEEPLLPEVLPSSTIPSEEEIFIEELPPIVDVPQENQEVFPSPTGTVEELPIPDEIPEEIQIVTSTDVVSTSTDQIPEEIVIVTTTDVVVTSTDVTVTSTDQMPETKPVLPVDAPELRLKSSPDDILGFLEDSNGMVKYAYKTNLRVDDIPAGEGVVSEVQKLGLKMSEEIVEDRTKNSRIFSTSDPAVLVAEFIPGEPQYYKDEAGEWWQADYGVTTKESYDYQMNPKKDESEIESLVSRFMKFIANIFFPAANAVTGTFYPDPGTSGPTGSATLERYISNSYSEYFNVIRAGVGTYVSSIDNPNNLAGMQSGTASDRWRALDRGIFTFDTSNIIDTATIISATFSIYGNNKFDNGTAISPDINVYAATPSSTYSFSALDYGRMGTTTQSDTAITYSGWNTAGYNDFVLNTAGKNNISKTGITKFGTRNANYDAASTSPAWSSNTGHFLQGYLAQEAGTSKDPKLVITYVTVPGVPVALLTEGQTNPTSTADFTPEFSALYLDDDSNDTATHYQIQVATSSVFASTYWDSDKTVLPDPVTGGTRIADISYAGPSLEYDTIYYWRIKFWDQEDVEGSWSSGSDYFMIPFEIIEPLPLDVASSTFYADSGISGPGGSATLERYISDASSEYFNVIRAGVGTYVSSIDNPNNFAGMQSGTANSRWRALDRAVLTFDTSAIPEDHVIISATLSIYGSGKMDNGTAISPNINVYNATPASNYNFSASDYGQIGTTTQSDAAISYSGWNTAGYNDFVLNAAGLANISTTGITKFGTRNANYDVASTTPAWSNNTGHFLQGYLAQEAGTSKDPKLTIVHSSVHVDPVISGLVQSIYYTYDRDGNITQLEDYSGTGTGKVLVFQYDDLNRLLLASTTAASSTPYRHTFAYGSTGNILGFATSTAATTTYSYAETGYTNPQAPTQIGSVSLTYDQNGNLTQEASSTYTWDYRNRMTASSDGSATSTYQYDHTTDRVSKTVGTSTTIYPSDLYDTDGTTKTKHIYANGELVATIETEGATSTTTYIHSDHLGSVNAVTDQSGEVIQVSDYYPYGQARIQTGTQDERGYIGEIYDEESSLSYLNARYLDSARGQFLSQDPVFWEMSQNLQNPQSLNSYAYANGNPIMGKDPDGREAYSGVLDQPYYPQVLNPVNYAALATVGYGAVAVGSVVVVLAVGLPWAWSQPMENETTIPFVDPGQFQTGTIQLEKSGFTTPISSDGSMPPTKPSGDGPRWSKIIRNGIVIVAATTYGIRSGAIERIISNPGTINQTTSPNTSNSNSKDTNKSIQNSQSGQSSNRSIMSQLSSALNQLSRALKALQRYLK